MNSIRWYLAAFMWRLQAWGWLRWFLPYAGGRHIDWYPVRCLDCGWQGPLRWCYHGYTACGEDDVEPQDECPKCHSSELDEFPS